MPRLRDRNDKIIKMVMVDRATYRQTAGAFGISPSVVAGVIYRYRNKDKIERSTAKRVRVEPDAYTLAMRRAARKRPFRPHDVPERGLPLVRRLFVLMNEQRVSIKAMEQAAGVRVSSWRHTTPRIDLLEACFNVLGRTLVDDALPKKRKKECLD